MVDVGAGFVPCHAGREGRREIDTECRRSADARWIEADEDTGKDCEGVGIAEAAQAWPRPRTRVHRAGTAWEYRVILRVVVSLYVRDKVPNVCSTSTAYTLWWQRE